MPESRTTTVADHPLGVPSVLETLVAEAKQVYRDPQLRAEAVAIAEECVETCNEALDRAEGRVPGALWPGEDNEKWWR